MESGMVYWPIERQPDGYPKGLSDDDKRTLEAAVRRVLELYRDTHQTQPEGLPLRIVVEKLRLHGRVKPHDEARPLGDNDVLLPSSYWTAVSWDWLYAATERALRAIKATPHYVLGSRW